MCGEGRRTIPPDPPETQDMAGLPHSFHAGFPGEAGPLGLDFTFSGIRMPWASALAGANPASLPKIPSPGLPFPKNSVRESSAQVARAASPLAKESLHFEGNPFRGAHRAFFYPGSATRRVGDSIYAHLKDMLFRQTKKTRAQRKRRLIFIDRFPHNGA